MTDRIPLDQLTSDRLDALHRRIDTLEHVAAGNKRHVQVMYAESQQARAELTQSENARDHLRRTVKIFAAELRTLRCGIRALGGDPTQIQNLWAQISLRNRQWREEKQRAKRTEAALIRIRDAAALHRQGLISAAELHAVIDTEPAPAATQAAQPAWCGSRARHDAHDWLDWAMHRHCPGHAPATTEADGPEQPAEPTEAEQVADTAATPQTVVLDPKEQS